MCACLACMCLHMCWKVLMSDAHKGRIKCSLWMVQQNGKKTPSKQKCQAHR